MSEETSSQELSRDREARIRELEARARRRPFAVRWTTALFAIALAVGLFAWQRVDRDLAYFFSSPEPVTLVKDGAFQADQLVDNRYAQVHGIPTETGVFLRDGEALYVMVGLKHTSLVVLREALPNESDRPPTPVDQRAFGVAGRLLLGTHAGKFERGVEELSSRHRIRDEQGRTWVLLGNERPGTDRGAVLLTAFLIAFVLLNLWFVARDLSARRRARAEGEA